MSHEEYNKWKVTPQLYHAATSSSPLIKKQCADDMLQKPYVLWVTEPIQFITPIRFATAHVDMIYNSPWHMINNWNWKKKKAARVEQEQA